MVELPLRVEGVVGVGEALRGTDVWTPQIDGEGKEGGKLGEKVYGTINHEPIEVLIKIENSRKWPTEIRALNESGIAFLIKIAAGLCGRITGTGWGTCVLVERCGVTWKLLLERSREIKILTDLTNRTAEEEKAMTWLDLNAGGKRVAHHTFVHGLGTGKGSYGNAVRIMRRWCQANMMGNLIPTSVIELLVARVYGAGKGTPEPPSSAAMGVYLTLKMLATFPFDTQPMVVDPRQHFNKEDLEIIQDDFDRSRRLGGRVDELWIVAGYDQKEVYTDKGVGKVFEPSFSQGVEKVAVNRVRALARTAVKHVLEEDSWSKAFSTTRKNLRAFDVVLKVDGMFVIDKHADSLKGDFEVGTWKRSMEARRKGYKKLRRVAYKNIKQPSPVAFNPVDSYVKSLEARFGDLAIFMYNRDAPTVIGIVVRPGIKGKMNFQANRLKFRMVKGDKVEFNMEEFKDTIVREGGGLIESGVIN
ncbi:hypothetical protein TrCOL_g1454 [Triparma columacea]|nr:hypothetical protein TrCOL_g1454 [Triparma columacea]